MKNEKSFEEFFANIVSTCVSIVEKGKSFSCDDVSAIEEYKTILLQKLENEKKSNCVWACSRSESRSKIFEYEC